MKQDLIAIRKIMLRDPMHKFGPHELRNAQWHVTKALIQCEGQKSSAEKEKWNKAFMRRKDRNMVRLIFLDLLILEC